MNRGATSQARRRSLLALRARTSVSAACRDATPPALSVFTIAALKAAAWYTYLPSGAGSLITPNYDAPGWYAKLAGFFRMAGKYCERTQYVDYAANAVGQPVCVSGRGSCGAVFKVTPPPIVVGQNGYKLIVPGCECG